MTLPAAGASQYTSTDASSRRSRRCPVARPAVFLLFAASLLLFSTGSPAAPLETVPPKAEPKKGDGFSGRTKEGKARLLKEFGGSPEGEEAVMLGLAWLTQMQKQDGHWAYEAGGHTKDYAAATG